MEVDGWGLVRLIAIFQIRNINEVLVILGTICTFDVIGPAGSLDEGIALSGLVLENIKESDRFLEGFRVYNELGEV